MTRRPVLPLVTLVLATAVVIAAAAAGWWWLAFPAGCAVALVVRRQRLALPLALLAGALGWGLPLAWYAWSYGLGETAGVLAGILGLGAVGAIPVALTSLVGALLAGTGAWLTGALLAVVAPAAGRSRPAAPEAPAELRRAA